MISERFEHENRSDPMKTEKDLSFSDKSFLREIQSCVLIGKPKFRSLFHDLNVRYVGFYHPDLVRRTKVFYQKRIGKL